MKPAHYTLEAYTARHAVFSSHLSETIIIDRKSGESVYSSGFDGHDILAQALRAANAKRLDVYAEPLIRQQGSDNLNACTMADIAAVLAELADIQACRRAA